MEKFLLKLIENKSIIEKFNNEQLLQVIDGVKKGIKASDLLLYADASYDAEKMEYIKNLLLNGFNISKMSGYIENLSKNQLKVIVECTKDKLEDDAIKYIVSLNCDFEDMRIVKGFIEKGFKVTPFIKDRNISGVALKCVLELLQTGYNQLKICELLDDERFDIRQKQELLQALKDGVDVSIFYNNSFDYLQIKFLRIKLSEGVDVTNYAKVKYSYAQMIELSALEQFDIPQTLFELFLVDGHRFENGELINYSEVIEGHTEGLNYEQISFYVSAYHNNCIEFEQMREIRNLLLNGESIDEIAFKYDINNYSSQEENNIIEGDF